MKKKILSTLLVGALVVALGACTGKQERKKKDSDGNGVSKKTENSLSPQEISLAESGYSVVDSGFGNVYLYYSASVNNPNEKVAAESPTITVTAKNADGSILATSDQMLFYVSPSDTVSFGGLVDCKGQTPASVEITATCKKYVPARKNMIHSSKLVVSNTSEITTDMGASYTGEVENTSEQDLGSVAVTVTLKNNGAVVYGETTYVSNLSKGSKQAFEIQSFQKLPEHTEYTITAQSWGL